MSYITTRRPPSQPNNHVAMGDIVSDAFNAFGALVAGGTAAALKLGAPRFTMVGGVAKATDAPTLEIFKDLQRQLNRVAKTSGFTIIAVDGMIGLGTTALAKQVQNVAANKRKDLASTTIGQAISENLIEQLTTLVATNVTTATSIATNAISLYSNVKALADFLAAPPSVSSPPPASPPAYVDLKTNLEVPQGAGASAADGWKRLGTGTQLAVVGALGIVGVIIARGGKRGKGSKGRARK